MISFRYHIVSIVAIFLAFALGIAVGTVKSRLSRARARLDPDRLPDRSPTTTTRSANPPAPTILTTEI